MPIRKVGAAYQYGKSGKPYKGKGALAKPEKQGRAIQASKARRVIAAKMTNQA